MTALEERFLVFSLLFCGFVCHTLKSSSVVLVAGQNIVFNFFFFLHSFYAKLYIKAPLYCETKFDTEYVPTQQEKNYSSI